MINSQMYIISYIFTPFGSGPVKTERANALLRRPTDIWPLFRVTAQSIYTDDCLFPASHSLFLSIFLALNRRIRYACVYEYVYYTRCADEGVGDRRAFNIARVENYDPPAFTLVFEVRSPVFRLIYRRRWSTIHDFPRGLFTAATEHIYIYTATYARIYRLYIVRPSVPLYIYPRTFPY